MATLVLRPILAAVTIQNTGKQAAAIVSMLRVSSSCIKDLRLNNTAIKPAGTITVEVLDKVDRLDEHIYIVEYRDGEGDKVAALMRVPSTFGK